METPSKPKDDKRMALDGGWGWFVVAGAFAISVLADGCSRSFGVLLTSLTVYFGSNRSDTAWIGSLFNALPLLCGPLASLLTNKVGFRKATIIGGIIICTGLVSSSFCNSIQTLYITYGFITGVGFSFPYLVSVVVISNYFEDKRAFATGLSECGGGLGTFIITPLLRYLISVYTWRGGVMILGGICCNIIVCGCLFREVSFGHHQNKPQGDENAISENAVSTCSQTFNKYVLSVSVLKNWKFSLFCVSNFVLFFWYDVPYVFIVDRAEQQGETSERATNLVTIMGVSHLVANVLYGYLGDRKWLNASYLYCFSMYFCGACVFTIPFVTQYLPSAVLASLFGIFTGAIESLAPSIIVSMLSVSQFTDAYGILMFLQGIATLTGPPFSAWLFDVSASYHNTFLSAGVCIFISGVLFHIVPVYAQIKRILRKQKKCKREMTLKREEIFSISFRHLEK